jgi:hypothetical protein
VLRAGKGGKIFVPRVELERLVAGLRQMVLAREGTKSKKEKP